MSVLRRLFGRTATAHTAFSAALAPDQPFFAVGDVHGCMTLMIRLLDQIAARDAHAPLVFVGDYVDRGERSADVLRHLMALDGAAHVTCLIGNHEEMMLNFLDDPATHGARWLRYGGLQTLASFGVGGVTVTSDSEAMRQAAEELRAAIGPQMLDWLRALPTHWQSGNVAVVHAAADPAMPIGQQDAKTLRWGHKDFATTPRTDDVWVVHGHTIVDEAHAAQGRIAIDTGAYATGRLTAAYITPGDIAFVQG